jgi:arylsulfatase A-like enzyme
MSTRPHRWILFGLALAAVVVVAVLANRTALREERPSHPSVRFEADLVDLTPLLREAGGSPPLEAGEPETVAAIRFDEPGALEAFRAERGIEGLRIENGRLAYGVTRNGNRLVWDCDVDAFDVTHVELSGLEMRHGRGPVLLFWQGPEDPPDRWRQTPFFLTFDGKPHDILVPVEDADGWSGRVARMALQFGLSITGMETAPARISLGGVRYLRMDLGTRRFRSGLPASIRRATIRNESRSVVHAPAPLVLPLSVTIPPRATLDFAIGVLPSNASKGGDGVVFRVAFEEEGAAVDTELLRRELDVKSNPADRVWHDVRIDLGPLAGKTGRLVFETAGGDPPPGDTGHDDALWAHPQITLPRDSRGPMNVLIVSLDTVRADHLGCYGYERNTTPRLDDFAEEAILFERAFAQAPETVSSHMTLFTSLYPSVHGIREVFEGKVLHAEVPTLARTLRDHEHPYRTAAFTEGGGVSSFIGFEHGFDRYHDGTAGGSRPQKMIEATFAHAIDWLRRNADRRFFLFLHTYEAHTPYVPPPPYDRMFGPGADGPIQPPLGTAQIEQLVLERRLKYGDPGVDRIVGLYDGEIRYLDDHLGALFDEMRGLGLLDSTLVIVLSDHGEDFFDHLSIASHGHTLYDELMHVPLLVRPPGGRGSAPDRIGAPVGLIDLMPTVLELVGADLPEGLQGESLVPLLEGRTRPERPVFFEDPTGIVRFGVRYHDVKRILSPGIENHDLIPLIRQYADVIALDRFEGILDEEQLFDLARDPEERRNLLAGPRAPELRDKYAARLADWKKLLERTRRETGQLGSVDPEDLERLRELGYRVSDFEE